MSTPLDAGWRQLLWPVPVVAEAATDLRPVDVGGVAAVDRIRGSSSSPQRCANVGIRCAEAFSNPLAGNRCGPRDDHATGLPGSERQRPGQVATSEGPLTPRHVVDALACAVDHAWVALAVAPGPAVRHRGAGIESVRVVQPGRRSRRLVGSRPMPAVAIVAKVGWSIRVETRTPNCS